MAPPGGGGGGIYKEDNVLFSGGACLPGGMECDILRSWPSANYGADSSSVRFSLSISMRMGSFLVSRPPWEHHGSALLMSSVSEMQ